ncbi:MAG: uroporphyrinogen-III synthase, partial [Usitatibacteraceae bacterium]
MQADFLLEGLTLVVTRPRVQAARTAAMLREAGASVIDFPVLEIAPIEAAIAPQTLSEASGIIFVSANAVEYGLPVFARAGRIQPTTQLFAIGRATAGALTDAGYENVVSPQQTIDSEGLLAMPQLQSVMGRHIILVKGASESGGRTLLEETLIARGARVMVLVCYRRGPIVPDLSAQDALQNSFAQGNWHACFALSAETLD